MQSPSAFVSVLYGKSWRDKQSSGNDREHCGTGAEAKQWHVSPHPPKASFLQISAVRVLELSARVSFVTWDAE